LSDSIKIIGTKISLIGLKGLLSFVAECVSDERQRKIPAIMASGNVHSFNMSHRLKWYQTFLNNADVVRLDGAGISLAAKWKGFEPPERSTWADFGWPLLELCAEKQFRVFFFGCAPGVAEAARAASVHRFPDLRIVGTEHGFIEWGDKYSLDNKNLVETINSSMADILIIGLGMPRQERWILDHKESLKVKLIMTGGAVFNYLSGKEKRAPEWMLNHGLEWLFRFSLEPKRLFSRYIIGNPVFLMRVVREVIFLKGLRVTSPYEREEAHLKYHGALRCLNFLKEETQGKAAVYHNPLTGGRVAILKRHLALLSLLKKSDGDSISLVREFSTIPLWLMSFLFSHRQKDTTYFIVNHNAQWAKNKTLEKLLFKDLIRRDFNFCFFETIEDAFFQELGIDADKAMVIPHPVDVSGGDSFLKPHSELKSKSLVGIMGEYREEKGIDAVLSEFSDVLTAAEFDLVLGFPNPSEFLNKSRYRASGFNVQDTSDHSRYLSLLRECDLLVVCGTASGYSYRASGLISDASRVGTMVLAPDFSLIEHQVSWPVPIGLCYNNPAEIPGLIKCILGRRCEFEDAMGAYRTARSISEIASCLERTIFIRTSLNVCVLGVHISILNEKDVLQIIDEKVALGHPALINNVNAHACNLAYTTPEFKDVLNRSEVVFCDGFGVKVAAWLRNKRLGTRMTPPDWIDELFQLCVDKGYSVYFLGDQEDVVALFADAVKERHPLLRIAGQHNGYFEIGGEEDDILLKEIYDSMADIIITGMGMPRQELWAARAKERLGRGVYIATGSMFRWYTKYEWRAPRYITDNGFEWLTRLIRRPLLHFKRYVIGLPLFFWRALTFKEKDG
jgi:N-acetylglucosaminyldiphosphoundecaprenol N-acetyl-beta-D-mannosaminyltransferase